MKVFISWSGPVAHALANELRQWLRQVVSQAEPWVSSEDIVKGKRWSAEIASELDATSQGVVVVTPTNQHEPWLNFEAGAIAKSNGTTRTLLFDIAPTDVTGPLAEFQHTIGTDHDDMFKFIQSINAETQTPLDESLLEKLFDRAWAEWEARFDHFRARAEEPGEPIQRTSVDMLAEMLDRLRTLERDSSAAPRGDASARDVLIGMYRPSERDVRIDRYLSELPLHVAKSWQISSSGINVVMERDDPSPDDLDTVSGRIRNALDFSDEVPVMFWTPSNRMAGYKNVKNPEEIPT